MIQWSASWMISTTRYIPSRRLIAGWKTVRDSYTKQYYCSGMLRFAIIYVCTYTIPCWNKINEIQNTCMCVVSWQVFASLFVCVCVFVCLCVWQAPRRQSMLTVWYSDALTSPHCNKEDAKCSMNWLEDVLAPPQVRVPLSQTNERLCQRTNMHANVWLGAHGHD